MPIDGNPDEDVHNKAYSDFMLALLDPAQRDAAKQNPIVGKILDKLTDADLDTLASVANNQSLTNHNRPLTLQDGE